MIIMIRNFNCLPWHNNFFYENSKNGSPLRACGDDSGLGYFNLICEIRVNLCLNNFLDCHGLTRIATNYLFLKIFFLICEIRVNLWLNKSFGISRLTSLVIYINFFWTDMKLMIRNLYFSQPPYLIRNTFLDLINKKDIIRQGLGVYG